MHCPATDNTSTTTQKHRAKMVGSMDSGSLTPLPSSSSSCGSSPPHKGSNRPSPSPSPLHKQRMDVGSLLLMVMLLLALLALQLPAVGAIQFDVGPYVTRVSSSKEGRSVLLCSACTTPGSTTSSK